eukprot:668625-Rhodomonas_salina.4
MSGQRRGEERRGEERRGACEAPLDDVDERTPTTRRQNHFASKIPRLGDGAGCEVFLPARHAQAYQPPRGVGRLHLHTLDRAVTIRDSAALRSVSLSSPLTLAWATQAGSLKVKGISFIFCYACNG